MHLMLCDTVVHLDPESAVFEAMLEGWSRQQRTRFLNEDGTIGPRVALVRRLAEFTNAYPWLCLDFHLPAGVEEPGDGDDGGGRPHILVHVLVHGVDGFGVGQVGEQDPGPDQSLIVAPASSRATRLMSKHRRAWVVGSGSQCPSGQTGPVPETSTRSPARTARENPTLVSNGEPELIRCTSPTAADDPVSDHEQPGLARGAGSPLPGARRSGLLTAGRPGGPSARSRPLRGRVLICPYFSPWGVPSLRCPGPASGR